MENKAFDHSKYRDWIDPNAVKPYERNAKIHDERQIKNIVNSIKRFGWQQDTVITADDVLVIGHGRRLAALRIGCEMPYHRIDKEADQLTDEDIRELRIAGNQTNAETGFDFDIMSLETADLTFDGFDFDLSEYTGAEETVDVKEDVPPEPPEEPRSKKGQIYQLGRHRLMCGDSTDAGDVGKLMAGTQADMLLTDPPYNVSLGQERGHALRPSEAKQLHRRTDGKIIQNDSWNSDEEFISFLTTAINQGINVIKSGAAFYIWYASTQELNFLLACKNAGIQIRQILIWNKNTFALGRQDYQWKHEPCLYGWKEGSHYFIKDRTQPTVWEDTTDFKKLKKEELVKILEDIFSDKVPTTVLNEKKPTASGIHPTMKPVALMARLIANSTKPGGTVLDLFGGSGSTMMACEQMGRACYTMELDPRYIDAIIERWETFTGEKAVLLSE